ncbi:hypothetical protein BD779DRAFT_349213 [Infundibulicybe gibba]|nr:hypothetical protein BD779DRAFT_349213 [Infundibulicybe gibba]
MRPLSLHTSALSDAEYTLYTSSLADLTLTPNAPHEDEDNFYEHTRLGVREARAWLRGRYAQVPAPSIDQILRMFSPNLAPEDTMTGGQFFAALRMVVHVEAGREVDRGFAFVQAELRPSVIRTQSNSNNPFRARSLVSPDGPPLPPRKPPPPPRHGSILPSIPVHTPLPPPPPPKPASHITSTLMKQSLQASKAGQTMKRAEEQLGMERVLRVLKSSSAPSTVSSEPSMPRTRTPSPHKRSAPGSSSSASASTSDHAPPLPRRRPSLYLSRHAHSRSPSVSESSLERVALAAAPTTHEAPPTHPGRKPPPPIPTASSRATSSGPPTPPASVHGHSEHGRPPSHPDIDASPISLSPRRSKSLHHPPTSPSPPTLPPPRRRRPESVQLPPSSSYVSPAPATTTPLSRRVSLSASMSTPSPQAQWLHLPTSRSDASTHSPLSHIQKTIAALQASPQVRTARYKAEAGVMRRGYVRGGEGLMHGESALPGGEEGDESEEEEGALRGARGRRRSGSMRKRGTRRLCRVVGGLRYSCRVLK